MNLRGVELVFFVLLVLFQFLRGVDSDEVLLSCSFETPCGLRHSSRSQYDWQRVGGATPNRNTGPSNDHTFGNSGGKYIYAPSSANGFQFGQRGMLFSPEYQLRSGRGRIEFYYHMWDGTRPDDMGSLSLYLCSTTAPAWTIRGNQGNRWRWTGQLDFSCQTPFRVYIVAGRGKYQSDIAVDDLVVTDVFEEPTTLITTIPPTTTPTIPTTHTTVVTSTSAQPSTPPATTAVSTRSTTEAPTTRTTTKMPSTTKRMPPEQTSTQELQTSENPKRQPTTVSSVSTSKMTAVFVETEQSTMVASNASPSPSVGDDGGQNLQSGSAPSFIGPVVVAVVALLIIALTLCLAVRRKKGTSKRVSPEKQAVKYTVENPAYGSVKDSVSFTNDNQVNSQGSKQTNNYAYQDLLQQSHSGADIDVTDNGDTLNSAEASGNAASNYYSYQDINECAPKRRGESALYEAIPTVEDNVDEYSYAYTNGTENGESATSQGGARKTSHKYYYIVADDGMAGGKGASPSAPSLGGGIDDEYAAVCDPHSSASGKEYGVSGPNSGMVENQIYVPFKE